MRLGGICEQMKCVLLMVPRRSLLHGGIQELRAQQLEIAQEEEAERRELEREALEEADGEEGGGGAAPAVRRGRDGEAKAGLLADDKEGRQEKRGAAKAEPKVDRLTAMAEAHLQSDSTGMGR